MEIVTDSAEKIRADSWKDTKGSKKIYIYIETLIQRGKAVVWEESGVLFSALLQN